MENWEKAVLRAKELRESGHMPSYGRKKTAYLKTTVLKHMNMTPAQFAASEPKVMFDAMAKAIVRVAIGEVKKADGALVVQAWREIKETIGERIGSNWKDTKENAEGKPDIINDLPSAAQAPN